MREKTITFQIVNIIGNEYIEVAYKKNAVEILNFYYFPSAHPFDVVKVLYVCEK